MLIAGVAAFICGKKIVWHVRVMERDRMLDRIRALLATSIIANSGAVAATLQPVTNDMCKISTIYNGIHFEQFRSLPPIDLRKEFSLPEHPVVLMVARLCAWKRVDILIEACKLLENGNHPDFTCLIIGQDAEAEPEYVRKIKAFPAKLGLKNVCFGGERRDVPAIMRSSDLLVLPSYFEPFGRVIIEAWACGLPVIATDAGGPAEIIEKGVSGLLFPVDDAVALAKCISQVLSNSQLRNQLKNEGLRCVRDFSLETHAFRIKQLYQTVLKFQNHESKQLRP
jgi:glycosyltransferase involved in cell wall biosynthesis